MIKNERDEKATPRIVSVDIPSGWHVENGNTLDTFEADMLISLTAPKASAIHHNGPHYLGGRFVPEQILNKYDCRIPEQFKYEGMN